MKIHSHSEALYGLGGIGALVYFLQHGQTLTEDIVGIVKAIFWPAVVLYRVLELLNL